ncbi:hypothetical protein V8J36_13465 [Frigidibacter sp. MR17.14]
MSLSLGSLVPDGIARPALPLLALACAGGLWGASVYSTIDRMLVASGLDTPVTSLPMQSTAPKPMVCQRAEIAGRYFDLDTVLNAG